MNRTITPEESNKLFVFVHKHYVYHYDLQVELVDHLASSIEEMWQENAEIPFEKALLNTFKKFGIHGFSKIKEQKQKELNRKYNRVIWKYLLNFLTWPKIVMTLAFTIILATALIIVENDIWIIVPYLGIITLFVIYYSYIVFPKRFKVSKINGKKFLLLEQLKRAQFASIIFTQVPLQSINFRNTIEGTFLDNNIGIYLISIFLVFFSLAMYGELFYVPQKIKEHFSEQFPEFAM